MPVHSSLHPTYVRYFPEAPGLLCSVSVLTFSLLSLTGSLRELARAVPASTYRPYQPLKTYSTIGRRR